MTRGISLPTKIHEIVFLKFYLSSQNTGLDLTSKLLADKTFDVELYMPVYCKFRVSENYKNARQATKFTFFNL